MKDKIMNTENTEAAEVKAPEPFLSSDAAVAHAKRFDPPVVEEPSAEDVAALETDTRTTFQKWLEKCIHNSPMSVNTEAYNYLLTQLPELEAMLNEEKAK